MGTRNLTMVIQDAEPKVAQYGQWDGYPDGQGAVVLGFLQRMKTNKRYSVSEKTEVDNENALSLDTFKERIRNVRWIDEKDIDRLERESNEMGDAFFKKYPAFTRDTAAEILEQIYNGTSVDLQNSIDFANDSLFCEWAYLIDLDNDVLEVYRGFNKEPLTEEDRFYTGNPANREFYPIRCAKKWSLDELPSYQEFLAEFEESEEDE